MLRHKRTVHADALESSEEEEELSDSTKEKEQPDSDDDTKYSLSENDDEEDPWNEIVNGAFVECQPQYEDKVKDLVDSEDIDQEMARSKAYKDIRSDYRKAMARTFIAKIIWYIVFKRDRVFRAIENTAKRLQEEEDYGKEEAWKYSVSKRKYLFDDILQRYIPPPINVIVDNMDADNQSDEESSFDENRIEEM